MVGWRVPFVAVLMIILATCQGRPQSDKPVVDARVVMATDATHADSVVKMAVLAQVVPGFHINDHKPSLDYLIPTRFEVDPSNQFTVKSVVYPKGILKKFPFSDVPLSVYEGKVVVGVILQVGKTVPVGTSALKAKFAYQACNDHACLAPTSVPVTLKIRVVPQNVPLKPVENDAFQRIKFE
jgi:hypothetical protein